MADFENNMFLRRLNKFGTYYFRGLITCPELRHLRGRVSFHEVDLFEILKSETLTCIKVAPPKPEPVVVRLNFLDILNDDAAESGVRKRSTSSTFDLTSIVGLSEGFFWHERTFDILTATSYTDR